MFISDFPLLLKVSKFPQLDIKSEGKYVIAPPSIHPSGAEYLCSNPDVPIRLIESLKSVGIDVSQPQEKPATTNGPIESVIPEGQRNSTLASVAGTMRRRGMSQESIFAALLVENRRCQPPLSETEIKAIAESVGKYPPDPRDNGNGILLRNTANLNGVYSGRDKSVTKSVTKDDILGWVRDTTGWFKCDELDRELGIKTEAEKANRRQIIKRLP